MASACNRWVTKQKSKGGIRSYTYNLETTTPNGKEGRREQDNQSKEWGRAAKASLGPSPQNYQCMCLN